MSVKLEVLRQRPAQSGVADARRAEEAGVLVRRPNPRDRGAPLHVLGDLDLVEILVEDRRVVVGVADVHGDPDPALPGVDLHDLAGDEGEVDDLVRLVVEERGVANADGEGGVVDSLVRCYLRKRAEQIAFLPLVFCLLAFSDYPREFFFAILTD